jgi:hypothetical protein
MDSFGGGGAAVVEHQPSEQVVLQRIRNRVIEDLEKAASYTEQRRYQDGVPLINVVTEIVCMWANDHVSEGWQSWFRFPVFTPEEIEAVARFDAVLHAVADSLPTATPQLSDLIRTEPWERLRLAAAESLAVFQLRGRLSEETDAAEPKHCT